METPRQRKQTRRYGSEHASNIFSLENDEEPEVINIVLVNSTYHGSTRWLNWFPLVVRKDGQRLSCSRRSDTYSRMAGDSGVEY